MKTHSSYENSTLEQLEDSNWGCPASQSHLITECHRLRRIPLSTFTAEDLRIMIGQDIGTNYLMPIAVAKLCNDPLLEADHYPGDLLCATLRASSAFWERNKNLRDEVAAIAQQAINQIDPSDKTLVRVLKEAISEFQSQQ